MNWTIEVLESLYSNYGSTTVDLTGLFTSRLILDHPERLSAASQAKDVLNALEGQGMIIWKVGIMSPGIPESIEPRWQWGPGYKELFGTHERNGVRYTFENCRVEGQLTVKGLDFMESRTRDISLHDSTMTANTSALALNSRLTSFNSWVILLTAAITLATIVQACLAYLSYRQGGPQPKIEIKR